MNASPSESLPIEESPQNIVDTGGKNPASAHDFFAVSESIPCNIEVEQALLAAILRDNTLLDDLHGIVTAQDFFHSWHAQMFDLMVRKISRDGIVRPETLAQMANIWAPGTDDAAAPIEYLHTLAANPVILSEAWRLGKIVAALRRRRELMEMSQELHRDARDRLDIDVDDLIEKTESYIYRIVGTQSQQRAISLDQASGEALSVARKSRENDRKLVGITTGFTKIDDVLGGMQRSDLIILAGRPSMGKTSLATNIAYNAALARLASRRSHPQWDASDSQHEGGHVLLLSMEMSSVQLATRILADQARIPSTRIRRGQVDDHELANIAQVRQQMKDVPITIDDSPALSVGQIRQRMRRMKRRQGLDLVVLDYLQLMRGDTHRMREGRVMEITDISQGLKALAKEFGVPILALSQLSRQPELREDKRPQLSDLRDSGSIEQDADVVMFIYREEYYMQRRRPTRREKDSEEDFLERIRLFEEQLQQVRNIAEVDIAKHRNGPVSRVELRFDGDLTRFDSLEENHDTSDLPPWTE